jgi:hypothetical protein
MRDEIYLLHQNFGLGLAAALPNPVSDVRHLMC